MKRHYGHSYCRTELMKRISDHALFECGPLARQFARDLSDDKKIVAEVGHAFAKNAFNVNIFARCVFLILHAAILLAKL